MLKQFNKGIQVFPRVKIASTTCGYRFDHN